MFWIALIWPGRLGLAPILSGCCVMCISGLWLNRNDLKPRPQGVAAFTALSHRTQLELALVVTILSACTGILFGSLYWPFENFLALTIYAPIAKEIFISRALTAGFNVHEVYPALLQLGYAFTYYACSSVNEYLAKLITALMAIGSLGVAAALGREMRSMRAGIVAAGLVALTPLFCKSVSTGNADIPGSFYFSLTALFAWQWWRDRGNKNAILTGMMTGFTMWTKNTTLVLPITIGLWIAANLRTSRIPWKQIGLFTIAILATAAPWYLRNLIVFHYLIPPQIWEFAAPRTQRTFAMLLAMTWDWIAFGGIGIIYTAAIAFSAIQFVRKRELESRALWGLLLTMVLPFYFAWWWLASYEVRFLVLIVPLLAVMAALMLEDALAVLMTNVSVAWVNRIGRIAICSVLILAPLSIRKTVSYKGAILSRPFMDDSEKHRIVLGGIYDLGIAIDHLPAGSRIVGVPPTAFYHIDSHRFKEISDLKMNTAPGTLKDRYDYVVYTFDDKQRPGWLQNCEPLLQTKDGYFLYSVRPARFISRPNNSLHPTADKYQKCSEDDGQAQR
ncbi:MAG: hypothetical protein C5B54_08535 [Acidobacteria bacterium]|nr:MAG: hypothetical protein C5B54_08535 [Acidobacteriota bacterium]